MAKVLSDTHEFVDGFVGECYNRGFTEEQTYDLLKTASRMELIEVGDPDFIEAFQKTAFKIPLNIGPKTLMGGGALVGGAALPALSRPAPFDSDESTMSGGLKGLTTGAGLGTLAGGILASVATRGRGGASNFRKFLSQANPIVRHKAVTSGSGKALGNIKQFKPGRTFSAMGKALSHPTSMKGMGIGALLGGNAGVGMGLSGGRGGGFSGMANGDYKPYYADGKGSSGGSASGGTSSKGTTDSGSIYSVPTDLKDYYSKGDGDGGAGAGSSYSGSGPMAAVRQGQARIEEIDDRIKTTQTFLAGVDQTDPNDQLRAYDMKREINRLTKERDKQIKTMNRYVSQINNDKSKMLDAAANDYALANNKHNAASGQFDRHMSFLNGGEDGSWWNNGWTAPILAKLLNSRANAGEALDRSNQYEGIMGNAQQALSRGR